MKPLNEVFNFEPVSNLKIFRDNLEHLSLIEILIDVEFPLLMQFKKNGENILQMWLDTTHRVNRFVNFKISDEDLERYKGKILTLKEVLQKSPEIFVWDSKFSNLDWNSVIDGGKVVSFDAQEYLPSNDSYHDPSLYYDPSTFIDLTVKT